ncbi:hypothetical protein ACLOJK_007813 [Asimina triloba]
MAIIVHSGTTIDPISGRSIYGKERMVYDYRKLNNNTHKDQYSLPGKWSSTEEVERLLQKLPEALTEIKSEPNKKYCKNLVRALQALPL